MPHSDAAERKVLPSMKRSINASHVRAEILEAPKALMDAQVKDLVQALHLKR